MTSTDPVRVLERRSTPGLLGIRFWDVGAGVAVRNHALTVSARSREGARVDAIVNRSGVWFFPALPGVNPAVVASRFEAGVLPATLARPYRVSVGEPLSAPHSFQPADFEVEAPIDGGLYDWPYGGTEAGSGSPPPAGYVPLFSQAGRSTPSGRLVVRAELWDTRGRPAAFALLEVTAEGGSGPETFLGLADERGAVVVFLPVPFVAPGSPRVAAALRTWAVGLRVSYAPSLTLDRSPPEALALPSLDRILAQRSAAPATAFAARQPELPLTTATLHASEPLILRTAGLPPDAASRLLVEPSL